MPKPPEEGQDSSKPRSNGLRRLAGTWSDEEHSEFVKALGNLERVDDRNLVVKPFIDR